MTIETAVIRLNTGLTPSGRFPAYWNFSSNWREVRLGLDAAVCAQKYEPWITEAYNTSAGSSFALRTVGKQIGSTSLSPGGIIQGPRIVGTRNLNATGKDDAFSRIHSASIDRFWEVNRYPGRAPDDLFVPTPTVGPTVTPCTAAFLIRSVAQIVSFTEGTGPEGYIELVPDRIAVFRARADAVNVLPYLVGSEPVVAQMYRDETLAYATYKPWQLISLPVLVLILGAIGELFVPTPPLNIPRRGFGVYSWLALLRSQARGFSRVPCTRANRPLSFRSCNSRRVMTSVSS